MPDESVSQQDIAALAAPVFGFSLQPSAEGKPNAYVAFHVDAPFQSHVFAIPVSGVDEWADNFAKSMKDLAAQARREESGFVVATDVTMNVLKGNK